MFDGVTGVDKTKPESVVNLLGGNARLVFLIATVLLVAGGGLLFWLLESAVSQPRERANKAAPQAEQRPRCRSHCCPLLQWFSPPCTSAGAVAAVLSLLPPAA